MMLTIRVRSAVWFATGVAMTLLVSLVVLNALNAEAAPGDADTTFVPITDCRLLDTRVPPERVGSEGPWGHAQSKTVQATGTNGECTIPSGAVGLSMKVLALNLHSAQDSFITFWPSGAKPFASGINPSATGLVSSAVTTSLSSTGSFNVYNNAGTVDLVFDVNGYYVKSSLQELHGNRVTAASNKKDDIAEPAANTYAVAMSVSVEAHSIGIIQVVGSAMVLTSGAEGQFDCRITRGLNETENTGSNNDLDDTDRRLHVGSSETDFCSTNGTVAVGPGTHVINLVVRKNATTGSFDDGTLQAIFIPGGTLDNTDG